MTKKTAQHDPVKGVTGLHGRAEPTLRALLTEIRGTVQFDAPMHEWTSFKIGGPADALVVPADLDDLREVVRKVRAARLPLHILGGTNVLVRDSGIAGVVISLAKLNGIREDEGGLLYAEAGVRMPVLMQFAATHSLSGLEWAAGIPGTVGGAIVMNAGTKLGEMRDAVHTVALVGNRGELLLRPASTLAFEYRRTVLPAGAVVAGVWVMLRSALRSHVESTIRTYLAYRKRTQPLTRPTAGCVFKNPEGDSAGRLIESVGMKGLRIGDAEVSEKHANFIINRGKARAEDVLQLIDDIRNRVVSRTGIALELELKIVGRT